MCGISAIVRGPRATLVARDLLAMTHRVRHRGPDDEGYLLWKSSGPLRKFAGAETSEASRTAHRLGTLPEGDHDWQVGLGHRRLSIVDLSPRGHQPMTTEREQLELAIAYNGEIYNHCELRPILEKAGHRFRSDTDTEVLLAAWATWGPSCLERLNGMFSFVLLDAARGFVHVVRDRFGVKPLLWTRIGNSWAFASEQKQLRGIPGFTPRLDLASARDYLVDGIADHTQHTFDENIRQLEGGEHLTIDLHDAKLPGHIARWYHLRSRASAASSSDTLRNALVDSVRLRLRADVPVGSCLSGGLDSSSIVSIAHQLLREKDSTAEQITVTAGSEDQRYDEWRFAEQVVRATGARPVRVWPKPEVLVDSFDRLLWHFDDPFGSTSMFAQWCVFEGAADAGLKVMLDGQGADEQLAGYTGADGSLYAGVIRRGGLFTLGGEAMAFRKRHGSWPIGHLIHASRTVFAPEQAPMRPPRPRWLKNELPSRLDPHPPKNLAELLKRQLLVTSLPALLRYEDRASMAWSIEARVPFLDVNFVELVAGIPEADKLSRGLTKVALREAMRGILPEGVRTRRDKMGFVTPEETWLRGPLRPWFEAQTRAAARAAPDLFDERELIAKVEAIASGREPFSFLPWRIVCFGRWLELTQNAGIAPTRARARDGAQHTEHRADLA